MAHLCMAEEEELALLPLGQTGSIEVRVQRQGEYTFHSKPAKARRRADRQCILIPWEESGKARWALVCSQDTNVCVNGIPVVCGLLVLSDRDAITVAERSSPIFFLDEDPARIQPFPETTHPVKCGRCKTPIAEERAAVRCPGCGQWYHQETGSKECWTYGKTCLACRHSTSLDGRFSWTPAGL